ncbi:hypothetical protein NHX12_024395 [Muraenolepis orangiensis]|uniref:alpha-N-acetylgalactosaminide alpha-2,6-sialyltransferase n=1 Tax=Muraenolepis orangiensis TaxID=630683 RepID=A0A9Q0IQN3_9TELE|nr:hypothetical protein NHX12_024395 [Muraenolepis orangiensis]
MAYQRMLLCFLAISGLLSIYVLCVSLEMWVPWRMADVSVLQTANNSRLIRQVTLHLSQGFLAALRINSGVLSIRDPGASTTTTAGPDRLWRAPTSQGTKHPTTAAKRLTTAKQAPGVLLSTQPVKPTKPDLIGNWYRAEDRRPQTTCPDAIFKKWLSKDFQERFIPTIPVLQWAEHATPQEYQRLKAFPGTYGWGMLDYQNLTASLSLLNLTANQRMLDDWDVRGNGSQCIRCAVVGNGGILNDSRKGAEIDGHDYVFRTNGAILKGFEQDVGSRTTHYIFTTNTMRNSMGAYHGAGFLGPPQSKETRYVFLPASIRDYLLVKAVATHTQVEQGPEKNKNPSTYFGEDASTEKLKIFHPDFVRYLRNRFLPRFRDIYRPTTGCVMLLAALHTCDQVNAYGFITPNFRNFSDHYFDKKYHKLIFYSNHDFNLEMNLWQELHKAGIMRLYMRP